MTSTTQTEPSIPADRKFRTSDGMFTVSSDHTIKSWNSAAERIFGITSEQAIGRKCHEVLCAKNGSNRVKCNRNCMVMSNAVKGRTTRDFDIDCKTRSGDIKTLNMSVVLTKADSNATEVLHLFRDVTDRRKVEITSYLNDFVEEAEKAGIEASASVRTGSPARQIVEEATESENSMVVMGSHGAGGLKRWVIGSVADKVVRSARRPVLVIPPKTG